MFSGHINGQGIHSPFVFALVSRVLRNKTNTDVVFKIEKIRKKLISEKRALIIRDLGAGSARMTTNLRKVSDITRYSAVPRKYGVVLANMAAEYGKPYIVEFGTSFGISTMYLAGGSTDALIYTMEGCPSIAEIAMKNFEDEGFHNIKQQIGSFDELLPSIKKIPGKPGLVFIDGNHRKGPLIDYFCQMGEVSGEETVVIIDDIHYSKEMEEAWNIIKQHKKVTMTIDINRMGFVFFREGITKLHYYIKY